MANNNSRNDNKGNNGGIQFLIFALQIFYKMHLLSTSLQAPIPWDSPSPPRNWWAAEPETDDWRRRRPLYRPTTPETTKPRNGKTGNRKQPAPGQSGKVNGARQCQHMEIARTAPKKKESGENPKGKRIAAATVTINWNDIANEHNITTQRKIM